MMSNDPPPLDDGQAFLVWMDKVNDDIREELAAYAHEAWASWMRYLFANCGAAQHGKVVIPALYADALRRQMHTRYVELTESEKESDRQEADKMLAIIDAIRGAPPQ